MGTMHKRTAQYIVAHRKICVAPYQADTLITILPRGGERACIVLVLLNFLRRAKVVLKGVSELWMPSIFETRLIFTLAKSALGDEEFLPTDVTNPLSRSLKACS